MVVYERLIRIWHRVISMVLLDEGQDELAKHRRGFTIIAGKRNTCRFGG